MRLRRLARELDVVGGKEELRQRRLDEQRWQQVLELSKAWREAQEAGRFIAALRLKPTDAGAQTRNRSVEDWLQ